MINDKRIEERVKISRNGDLCFKYYNQYYYLKGTSIKPINYYKLDNSCSIYSQNVKISEYISDLNFSLIGEVISINNDFAIIISETIDKLNQSIRLKLKYLSSYFGYLKEETKIFYSFEELSLILKTSKINDEDYNSNDFNLDDINIVNVDI